MDEKCDGCIYKEALGIRCEYPLLMAIDKKTRAKLYPTLADARREGLCGPEAVWYIPADQKEALINQKGIMVTDNYVIFKAGKVPEKRVVLPVGEATISIQYHCPICKTERRVSCPICYGRGTFHTTLDLKAKSISIEFPKTFTVVQPMELFEKLYADGLEQTAKEMEKINKTFDLSVGGKTCQTEEPEKP